MLKHLGKRMLMFLLALVVIIAQFGFIAPQANVAHAADKALALKPYMGWSSYSQQVIHSPDSWLTAEHIIAQSDAMHEKLQAHGYNYINVDAGWNGDIDEYGRPIPSTDVFPNGMQEVIDHVHANGQKFGLYIIPGLGKEAYDQDLPIYGTNCTMRDIVVQPLSQANYWGFGYKIDFSNPCAQSYINSVADKFGEWGVDFIKLDSVMPGSGRYDLSIDTRDNVAAWSQALAKHNIWLELSWALDINYADTWKTYANGWRIHWDIECYCNTLTKWDNISRLFPTAAQWWRHAGPGGWNDFDSLNIGNGAIDGLTPDERRTTMTFFAVSAVPLYSGNDLTNLDDYGVQLLTNDEVIAVNQAGRPARPLSTDTNQQVWYTNNGDGTYTVGLFNLDNTAADVNVNWNDIGIAGPANVRDLWSHTELGTYNTGFSAANLPAHGSRLLKVTLKNGTSFVNDDDVSIKYSGSWERNNGSQFPSSAQSLLVDVTDSQTQNSSLTPFSVQFDKKVGAQVDVTIALTPNGNTLTGIARGSTQLAKGTDYIVSGNSVTLKKEYLATLPVGSSNLIFSFSGGEAQMLAVAVKDTTIRDSSVLPAVLDFDKGNENQEGPTTSIAYNGNDLVSIASGGSLLSEGDQYTLSGNLVSFKNDFITALPIGTTELSFTFSGGAAQTVTLVVKDSTIGGSFSLNDDDPAIVYNGTWNSNTNRGLGDYKDDIHWSETAGDSFQYTFTGTGIELITELDGSQGKIDIYLDDIFQRTVNTSNTSRSTHHVIFNAAGLQPGSHTLKAVKRASDDGGGWFMLLDELRVILPDLVSPVASVFDKSEAMPTDLQAAIASGYEVGAITNGGAALRNGTDYSVAGNVLTIKKEYLATQPVDKVKLIVTFGGRVKQQLAIQVIDSAASNSTIAPLSADFDKKLSAQADIQTTMTLGANQLLRIVNDNVVLSEGSDYSISGAEVTIKKAYLAKRPNGTTRLKFVFDKGEPQTFSIAVRDTTSPKSSIIPRVISFDKTKAMQSDVSTTMTLNGNSLDSIANGATTLVLGSDYTVSDNQVSFNRAYLSSLSPGMTNLVLTFSAGAPVTLPIAITESLRGRYVDINDDDAGILYTGAWNSNTNRGIGDFKDDIHWSETNGNSFEYKFKGTGIDLITELDSSHGEMDIYLDNAFMQTIDTYINTTRITHRTVFTVAGLPEGEHTIKAVKKTGQFMLLDQFRYKITDMIGPDRASFDKSGAAPQDVTTELAFDARNLTGISNGNTLLQLGTDYTQSGNTVTIKKEYLALQPIGDTNLKFSILGDYEDDVHVTVNNGDSFEYSFKGTGIDIIAPTDPSQGRMDVYVDGQFKETVSLKGDIRLSRQNVFTISGLTNGFHTVKGVKKDGSAIILDGLRFSVTSVSSNGGSNPGNPPVGGKDVVSYSLDVIGSDGRKKSIDLNVERIKEGIVSIASDMKDGGIFVLPVDFLDEIKDLISKPAAVIRFETPFASMQLPISNLKAAVLATKSGHEGDDWRLNIAIQQGANAAMQTAVNTSKAQGLIDPVRFGASLLDQKGNSVPILSLGKHLERTISLGETVVKDTATAALLDGEGKFRFVPMTISKREGNTIALLKGGNTGLFTIIDLPVSFADLKKHWAKPEIELLASKLIVQGRHTDLFDPNAVITRGEVAALLVRVLGLNEVEQTSAYPETRGKWYASAVAAAQESGLLKGYADGSFKPDAQITREELVTILMRAVGYVEAKLKPSVQPQTFRDKGAVSPWALEAMNQAAELGIIKGDSQGAIKPASSTTRAEAAVMLYRLLKQLDYI